MENVPELETDNVNKTPTPNAEGDPEIQVFTWAFLS